MTNATETLTDRLTRGIIAAIDADDLRPGDPLPTVRQLAEKFEVTAPTIREALRRLQATDSITMRHGSGIYVGPNIDRMLFANPNGTRLTSERVIALVEARMTIEPGIAALAAAHRTDEQLAAMSAAAQLTGSDTDATDGGGDLAAAGVRTFHRELARASGNPMLFEILDSLLSVYSREQRRVRHTIEDPDHDRRQHTDILGAIRDRDASAASDLTAAHLREVLDGVRSQV